MLRAFFLALVVATAVAGCGASQREAAPPRAAGGGGLEIALARLDEAVPATLYARAGAIRLDGRRRPMRADPLQRLRDDPPVNMT
jgi:hypothetical protein